jgi:hypothetical protein
LDEKKKGKYINLIQKEKKINAPRQTGRKIGPEPILP